MGEPLSIVGQDLYDTRVARGQKMFYPPVLSPGRCIVCGARHTTCVDDSGSESFLNANTIIEFPEDM